MKMTIEEFLQCPKGMPFEEYEKRLRKIRRTRSRLDKLCRDRDFLEDGLQILSDEQGSDRWLNKKAQLDKINSDIAKCLSILND